MLNGLTALVTGGCRGIGRAISLALAGAGVQLMITARTGEDLENLANEINEAGGNCDYLVADLEDPEAPVGLIDKSVHRFGGLDILINNAGVLSTSPVADQSIAEWDRMMAVNVRAPFLLCQAALHHLKRSGRASIIQIASVVGEKSYPGQGAYTASKHALMGFSKVLAREVKGDGIRVHTILPGGVDTDMIAEGSPELSSEELMSPGEVADIVMFLLTHRGNAVIDAVRIRRSARDPWF